MSEKEHAQAAEAARRMKAAYEGSCMDYIAKDELLVANFVLSLSAREDDARQEMRESQEFIAATIRHLKQRVDYRLNDHLCEMKEGYDDSITGFNEAWDVVREIFKEATDNLAANTSLPLK